MLSTVLNEFLPGQGDVVPVLRGFLLSSSPSLLSLNFKSPFSLQRSFGGKSFRGRIFSNLLAHPSTLITQVEVHVKTLVVIPCSSFPEDRAFEVTQWEKSTFVWKMERFLYDQPQMFLEPSGISDSGAFSQSTFSELQSEEDKGNYQFVVVVFVVVVVVAVVVVASLNYTYSCTPPWWSCMTNNKCSMSLCRN